MSRSKLSAQMPSFLKEILSQPIRYESWLHRSLFIAVKCLVEDVEVADEEFVAEILGKLIKLEISDSEQVGSKIREQVFKGICSLSETRFEAQALQLLKTSADGIDEMRLLEYRAALGEKQEAIAILLSQLEDWDCWYLSMQ